MDVLSRLVVDDELQYIDRRLCLADLLLCMPTILAEAYIKLLQFIMLYLLWDILDDFLGSTPMQVLYAKRKEMNSTIIFSLNFIFLFFIVAFSIKLSLESILNYKNTPKTCLFHNFRILTPILVVLEPTDSSRQVDLFYAVVFFVWYNVIFIYCFLCVLDHIKQLKTNLRGITLFHTLDKLVGLIAHMFKNIYLDNLVEKEKRNEEEKDLMGVV
ncbi:hypothetical protein ACJX0J_036176 [Zea mays]